MKKIMLRFRAFPNSTERGPYTLNNDTGHEPIVYITPTQIVSVFVLRELGFTIEECEPEKITITKDLFDHVWNSSAGPDAAWSYLVEKSGK